MALAQSKKVRSRPPLGSSKKPQQQRQWQRQRQRERERPLKGQSHELRMRDILPLGALTQ